MRKIQQMLWDLAKIKIILFSAGSLWTCWATATNKLDMSVLGWFDWFQIIGGCIAAWIWTMAAFVDKSAGELASGKIPGLGDVKIDGEGSIKTTTTVETTPPTTVSTTVNETKP